MSACSSSVRFTSATTTHIKQAQARASSTQSETRQREHEINISKIEVPKQLPMKSTQEGLIEEANKLLGTPYCYGGQNYDCTDCSGFILQCYNSIGIQLPRTAALQYEYAQKINGDPEVGDLVFFSGNGKDITHVGMYIGGGEFVHASTSNGVIRSSIAETYYHEHFSSYRRIGKLYSGI
jgi:cell wall-associated NlpC family hydrolase